MPLVMRFRYLSLFVCLLAWTVSPAAGATTFFPLQDVKAGMRGIGKTVFSGDRIEEFQVEILGVLENIGPKQSLILARLSGGPIEKTGVMPASLFRKQAYGSTIQTSWRRFQNGLKR